jgi:hypothetical protein
LGDEAAFEHYPGRRGRGDGDVANLGALGPRIGGSQLGALDDRAEDDSHLPEPQLRPDAESTGPLLPRPREPPDVANWDQAKQWFNFGTLEVGAEGDLTAEVIDTAGEPRFSLTLEP